MSDTPSDRPAATPLADDPQPAANAQQAAAPTFILKSQYIKDLSVENPKAPEIFATTPTAPEIAIKIDVQVRPLAENEFEVILQVNSEASTAGETLLILELAYGGVFAVGGVPQEHVEPILFIEAPRLLFPFARSIVADATRDSGFPPLLLQPIDFVNMYRERRHELKPPPAA